MLTPRQEKEFITKLNGNVKRYSDAPLDIIFDTISKVDYIDKDSFDEIYTEDLGRNQHSIQVASVFKIDEYFVQCNYDLPIGIDESNLYQTTMEFFYVVPDDLRDNKFIRDKGGDR